MNRHYISTLYTSELILKIKTTSSNVFPAHAVPMMSALTMIPHEAFSFTPGQACSLRAIPRTVSYLLACLVSLSLTTRPVRSQGKLKFLHVTRSLWCPMVLKLDSSLSTPASSGQVTGREVSPGQVWAP